MTRAEVNVVPDYLADAYALIELAKGNPEYERFSSTQLLTTVFGNTEAFYALLRLGDQEYALQALTEYQETAQPITAEIIAKAMQFRLEHKNENLSYADCIGYATARELGIPFLTGDKAFKGKEGVAFVS